MDASKSIQSLTHGLEHHKRQRQRQSSLAQMILLTLQPQDEEILSDRCFGPCGSGSCKSVQLPAGRNCDCDLQGGDSIPASSSVPVTSAPPPGNTTVTGSSGDYMTISITNVYGTQLSLSFASNAGGPAPVGNPSATILPDASPTYYAFPTGWAGRINVGPNTNPLGSKIEGSFTGPPDIDVSYVDGYSVPITCSSEGTAVSGCNIELFKQPGITCNNQVDGPVCLNSAQDIADGPAPPFFTACAGAAYTYPNDNEANVSNLKSNLVSCCIGTSCEAPSRQPPKRGNPTPKSSIRIRNDEPRAVKARGSPPSTLPFAHKLGHHHHSRRSRVHGAVH